MAIEGEKLVSELAECFGFSARDIIPDFREYMRSSKSTKKCSALLTIEDIIPVSSAKAERGFSQMNLVATDTRANLTVSNISDMFIRLNGPPAALWDPSSARSRWLRENHRTADDPRSKTVKRPVATNRIQRLFCKM
jgi:hypothetical protein